MQSELTATIEALLFVAAAPISTADMAEAAQATHAEVEDALQRLALRLNADSGLQLVRLAGGYQLCTKKLFAEAVARLLRPQKQRLSRSALEVLAIVAYRQPVTAAEVEIVRGVQSDHALRTLTDRGLIHEVDRKTTPGRPILYGTTQQFLHQFKLNALDELPPLEGEPKVEELSV